MTDRRVTVERDGDVLLLGVDRAAKRNAWDLQVVREVGEAFEQLARRAQEAAAADHLREVLPTLVGSEDAAEGVRSFLERRDARFTGR
jgi:enoyl-CoA hydratase/carnithine racemase